MKPLIVITRPEHQTETLARGIQAVGADVLLFPTLAIVPVEPSPEAKEQIQHLNHYDIVIFISPNAVEHGLNQIQALIPFPDDVLLATVGQGSAKTLKDRLGKQPDIVPTHHFNSEGLLATNAMQNVANKRILIIRGNAGREHLKQSLQQRGAKVDYLGVYKRIKPATPSTELEQHLQNNQIAAIVITSGESLNNLTEMVSAKVKEQLLQTPLLLINPRLADIAREAGFSGKLLIAAEASDDAIIKTLTETILLRPLHG